MNLKIFYIGEDDKYWKRLKAQFEKKYPNFEFSFKNLKMGDFVSFQRLFIYLFEQHPDIIYLDYTKEPDQGIGLAKLLTRNEEMRLVSVVGLFDSRNLTLVDRSINASVRLNHIKCLEIDDVVYDPMALLDVELPEPQEFVASAEVGKFEFYQPLRVGFIGENHFHVETNSKLPIGEILTIDHHPLENIMSSKLVYVQKFYEHDLYFNKRYAYELEFIYKDDDFFVSTNEHWKLYKNLKENPALLNEMKEVEKQDIMNDMAKRKEMFEPIRENILKWIRHNRVSRDPKKLKILVVDETLDLFKELDKKHQSFRYSINFQTHLGENSQVIFRYTPHLIAFNFSDKRNQLEDFNRMMSSILQIKNYHPYVLAFGIKAENATQLAEKNYQNVITYPESIGTNMLLDMAGKLDDKLHITEKNKKVFVKATDKFSRIHIKRELKVVSMTESILYFESKHEIPMWTVFRVNSPPEFLITVVPHINEGKFSKEKDTYRALINFTGEHEKAQLRTLINRSLKEEKE